MISNSETEIVSRALQTALDAGAQKARITYSKSDEELVATLNGEVDKVTRCTDRSLSIALFADGHYGSFSTNNVEPAALGAFIRKAVDIVHKIAPDPCRDLPDPQRCCHDALTGLELGLTDPARESVTPEQRIRAALDASVFNRRNELPGGCTLISEEGEYSDSIYETLLMDSNGLCCRHSETSFDYGVETTVEAGGEKYSGYWWDSSSHAADGDYSRCSREALRKAAAQIGSEPAGSGRYNMVVDSEVASKLVSPLLHALNAFSLQQNNSFLTGSLGKKMFPEGMTLMDFPRIPGQTCSKYFDSEGVATADAPIIENGVVREYFVNSYMSLKMGVAPTVEAATRPKLMPWNGSGMRRDGILRLCGDGILVTDFNGGNCNQATGDFSYGIEGFLFRNGEIVRPVSGMLVTGNFLKLWDGLIAAGDDARPCMSKLIPTVGFAGVDFSG